MRTSHAVLWALALLSAGCSKKAPDPAARAPSPESVAPSPESVASSSSSLAAAGAGLGTTLADRLQREARSRPHIEPNADDVLAAFARAGDGVVTKRQGLGATYQASFCEGGTTGDGSITISICEYPDDGSAKAGLAAMQSTYPVKQANHALHKDTVLTTLRLQDGPAAHALESKLVAAYAAL